MPNNKKTPAMPEKIRKEYHLVSLLSLHENAVVFSLEKKKSSSAKDTYVMHPNSAQVVVKVMPKSYFDEELFSTLQSLHHPLLLLPMELIMEGEYVYALYPKLLPFSEYLSRGKIPLSKMTQWIKDMSQILSCLHEKHIIHGDIAPGNIYLDDEGHFYLGDFSSGKITSSHQMITSLIKNKNKTAATFPFSSSCEDFRQDIFSFLTILLKLLEASSSDVKDDTAILSNLQNFVESQLLELREKKSFPLTFREVCQKLLSAIEENENKHNYSKQDFLLSPEKLDFLNAVTKPIRKNTFSSSLPQTSKGTRPILALAFCCIVFLSAIFYYGRTSIFQEKKTIPTSDQLLQKDTLISDGEQADTKIVPTEQAIPTTTPTTNPPASPTSAANQQDNSILDISGKQYGEITSSSKTNSAIKIIFAQGNQIKKLSSFSIYPALEELYLDGNVISDLTHLPHFKHLAILGLSNNQVTDLSTLKNIPSLKILDLSGQKHLSHLSSLRRFKNLEYLILTDTNATDDDLQRLQQSLPRCMILR